MMNLHLVTFSCQNGWKLTGIIFFCWCLVLCFFSSPSILTIRPSLVSCPPVCPSLSEVQNCQRAYFYQRFPFLHLEPGDIFVSLSLSRDVLFLLHLHQLSCVTVFLRGVELCLWYFCCLSSLCNIVCFGASAVGLWYCRNGYKRHGFGSVLTSETWPQYAVTHTHRVQNSLNITMADV